MNILVQGEGTGWVLDNIVADYKKYTRHNIVSKNPDLVWCVSMQKASTVIQYKCKKVISIHHIDKYQYSQYPPIFKYINKYFDYCISPCDSTIIEASCDISIPFMKIPYWVLSDRMNNIDSKSNAEQIVIGSFIKDSWGYKPKMSKGPDVLIKAILQMNQQHNIKILLTGIGGRQYVRQALDRAGVKYDFLNNIADINDAYNQIDWYFITSKYEGGPQSVLECAYRKIKILSTNVGMASDVLHKDCIYNDVNELVVKFNKVVDRTEFNYKSVCDNYTPSKIISYLDDFFDTINGVV